MTAQSREIGTNSLRQTRLKFQSMQLEGRDEGTLSQLPSWCDGGKGKSGSLREEEKSLMYIVDTAADPPILEIPEMKDILGVYLKPSPGK